MLACFSQHRGFSEQGEDGKEGGMGWREDVPVGGVALGGARIWQLFQGLQIQQPEDTSWCSQLFHVNLLKREGQGSQMV